MDTIRITVPGRPVPKGRGRFARGRVYTPFPTAQQQKCIRDAAIEVIGKQPIHQGAVLAEMEFSFEPPRRYGKARQQAILGTAHTIKPDGDNLAKLVLDALNGVVYKDDAQVFAMSVRKVWGTDMYSKCTLHLIPSTAA